MASIRVTGIYGVGKSVSWGMGYTIKLPECLLCKKQGMFGIQGETFNPRLGARLPLCKGHWKTWRKNLFSLPVKTRRKMVQKLKSRLEPVDFYEFKALFSMFWDLLQISAETKNASHAESFFAMKKAA